ncbi:MAG TPA: hypothetical protein CFH84_06775 [Sulfurimonas sp. UBA12504]|nr:MAG: hypothetical protein A2019_07335 [Sulfurimonas sp. GWF2_37_8]DAB29899.1 MAG TPA: hypothetical protein CFH84_06775 [Sulfurimonas sp. UBA12504]
MSDQKLLQATLNEINELKAEVFSVDTKVDINCAYRRSLLNLKHYLILRSKDRTKLQEKLFSLSLSSLGRSYAHVAWSINTLHKRINTNLSSQTSHDFSSDFSIQSATKLSSSNAAQLFGTNANSKSLQQETAIMVTLPSYAAEYNGLLIHDLANVGVNAFRINTAHDDANIWKAMADIIVQINESRDANSKIKIFVDLAGPKIRTTKIRKINIPIEIGSNKIQKDILIFHAKSMATISESLNEITRQKKPARIVVNKKLFKKIENGSVLKIIDVNSKKALIAVTDINDVFATATIDKKAYLDDTAKIYKKRTQGKLLNIQKQPELIRLQKDDLLVIGPSDKEGSAALYDDAMNLIEPAYIGCSFSGIEKYVNIADKIFIDDGKIGLVVVKKEETHITCKVILAKENGILVKEGKGINFPDSHIMTAAFTQNDRENIIPILDFADHISLSFCQSAQDIRDLKVLLRKQGREDIGIVAKIETKQAVSNMPEILEELLEWEKRAIMIARGDLAIEVGFEKLAYIQESLLDICDAAHIPVIWATQVLENQMKNNLPSRAEITDAAMSGRAECVMLNKGPFAIDTISVLKSILDDMHSISKKNRQLLSKETLW